MQLFFFNIFHRTIGFSIHGPGRGLSKKNSHTRAATTFTTQEQNTQLLCDLPATSTGHTVSYLVQSKEEYKLEVIHNTL